MVVEKSAAAGGLSIPEFRRILWKTDNGGVGRGGAEGRNSA